MKTDYRLYIFLMFIAVVFCYGCANQKAYQAKANYDIYDVRHINDGLPTSGLWRQNIVLYDVNKDGFLDIVAPPLRKAVEPEAKKPSIFVWDDVTKGWKRGQYNFPDINDYDFGGIAVGDINNDGLFDIVLAVHKGRIITLINDGKNGFIEKPVQMPQRPFHSRALKLVDLNADGWLDLVSASEAEFISGYTPAGILVGLNNKQGWDTFILDDSINIFADSIDVSNLNVDKQVNILIAPLTNVTSLHKIIWTTSDGKRFDTRVVKGLDIPISVKACDVDGDGNDELMVLNSGIGQHSSVFLKVFKLDNTEIVDISEGLTKTPRVYAINCADLDQNGKKKVVLFNSEGMEIWSFIQGRFVKEFTYRLDIKDVEYMFGFEIGLNKDGTWTIVCNFGSEMTETKGLKAFRVRRLF